MILNTKQRLTWIFLFTESGLRWAEGRRPDFLFTNNNKEEACIRESGGDSCCLFCLHIDSGSLFQAYFCFAVCAPISPLSLSTKSVSCRFDKRICAGVEVWMSFTSLVWQEETARCGLSLTKVKNHEVCWLCENKVWNEKQRLLADFLVSWRKNHQLHLKNSVILCMST